MGWASGYIEPLKRGDTKAREPISSVLVSPRWRRGLVIAALLLAPVTVLEWPWEFLPLRWQYSFETGRGERAIAAIEKFKAAAGRLPSQKELWEKLDPFDWPCYECYQDDGRSYILIATASFDWAVIYDSRTRQWRRSP